jgi:hypothetical protein
MPAGTPVFVASGYPHPCGSAAQSDGVAEGAGDPDPADEDGPGVAWWEVPDGRAEDEDGAGAEAVLAAWPAVEFPA